MTRSNFAALGDPVAEGQSASWVRAFAHNRLGCGLDYTFTPLRRKTVGARGKPANCHGRASLAEKIDELPPIARVVPGYLKPLHKRSGDQKGMMLKEPKSASPRGEPCHGDKDGKK